jgi:putative ABC transport system permease protein
MSARAWAFAWRSLARQPGRAFLGVLGIAAVGALLFDMLLLSRGLLVSLRDLLDSAGFDVRVIAGEGPVAAGPRITQAAAAVAAVRALPEVDEVVPLRFGEASTAGRDGRAHSLFFAGADPGRRRPWILLEGSDVDHAGGGPPPLVINRTLAGTLKLSAGGEVALRGECAQEGVAPPPVRFRVTGIVAFPFDDSKALTAAARLADFRRACGLEDDDDADLLLVASRPAGGPLAAVQAIRALRPDLHAFSNEELVARFQATGFSYFRQISTVLSSITLFFGFLLITVLLTVSVNQRFAEIAALRALGFSRRRVVEDVLVQAVLLVGTGGALSLPLGLALSRWLEGILHGMPEIPTNMHFFLFEPRALALHGLLLALTAVLAALYPMRLVARLPIASTLRSETVT